MKRALLGLAAIAAIATSVILWLFAGIDRDQRADFEQEVERVQWGILSEPALLATWTSAGDSLTLDRAWRCRYDFGHWDHDVFASEERQGTWEVAGGELTVRCERAPSILRTGHLDSEPVLVSDGRIWRRGAE